ncbi:hypothetical protein AMS68_006446 [Peltaster fructicola]|uniref:Uncharacterized protein n=1 Tax=Peltaster fructicola TaxID=286661 RepID=A0A6H0Y231_9PEZI|nr:hypothetical protein AMS68_006446 [Peltaster fructicola]
MSSFFTAPASQRKRKRPQTTSRPLPKSKPTAQDDDSISGSDISDDAALDGAADSEDDSDDGALEDAATKRIRLAEQYLANTQKETLEEVGFDAADVDQENLRRRMGDRLKEDTAETRGRLYKYIADDVDWRAATKATFRADTTTLTGISIAAGHVYTVSRDISLIKWRLPAPGQLSRKPKKVKFTRGGKRVLEHHQKAILCVAASADGKFVATGGEDNKIIIWDAHSDSAEGVHGKDRTVKVWSCDELAYVETLFGHQDEVLDVDVLAKEICVSVGARDRTARYWRVVEETQLVFRGGGSGRSRNKTTDKTDSGMELPDLDAAGHEGSIDRVAFVDDDTFITGSDNGALALWNIHKKKAVFTLPLAHGLQPPPPLGSRSAEHNMDNQYMDFELLGDIPSTPRWITALKVVPYSNIIVSGSWDGYMRAFKITTDRRRIERISIVGQEELSKVNGVINDLSIVEQGERGQDGLLIAAAVGSTHRLGSWQSQDCNNAGYTFEIPRRTAAESPSPDGAGNDGFDGFD